MHIGVQSTTICSQDFSKVTITLATIYICWKQLKVRGI